MATAARCLDANDVARVQLPRQLRRLVLAVDERSAARAWLPTFPPWGRMTAPLREHREPAVLEHAELPHDTVAALVRPGAP